MAYLRLNEEFHHLFRELAKSAQLGRALDHALALPFAPPSALLMVHSALPQSWELLLVAQHQHQALVDAIGRREGARADAIAREHARIARRNLDIALENRQPPRARAGLDASPPPRGHDDEKGARVSHRSLEDLLTTAGNPVELLRNSPAGPNVYPGVPPEYTNWRDEQRAWQDTCVLFNQSYHMDDLAGGRPGRARAALLARGQQLRRVPRGPAKHFVPCTPDGYVIGDVILFRLTASASTWSAGFRRSTGSSSTRRPADTTSRSSSTCGRALRTDGHRRSYRFQVQGPNAMQVIEKALGPRRPS